MKVFNSIQKTTVLSILVGCLLTIPFKTYALIPQSDRSINLKAVVVMKPISNNLINKDVIATYLPAPSELEPTRNGSALAEKFELELTQSIAQAILNGDTFRKSSIGQITTAVEKAAQGEVKLAPAAPGGVEQKINFALNAAQKTAVIAYEGYFKSDLSYVHDESNVKFGVFKALTASTNISLTHSAPTISGSESKTMFLVQHTF